MSMKNTAGLCCCLFATACAAATLSPDVSKFDPLMAGAGAAVDTNGVKWIDGKFLPLEGKAFDDVEEFYDRLPAVLSTNINKGVHGMKHHTSGMLFRFSTDSDFLIVRMTPRERSHGSYHMTECGQSGFDVYGRTPGAESWKHLGSSHNGEVLDKKTTARQKRYRWVPNDECIVNLPLYNGVREFKIGIARDATVRALPPRRSGVTKPVVFYGTSITHGACASRPGLAFVNAVGRRCDVPVVGLGFSGSGCMEFEMSDLLARIDASCYVLDCLHNMTLSGSKKNMNVSDNYEPFVRNLRAKRPGVPIVMAERSDVYSGRYKHMNDYVRRIYDKLVAEGMKGLHYLPADAMYSGDTEGSGDGIHPNDLGMMTMADAYGKAVRQALFLDSRIVCPVRRLK